MRILSRAALPLYLACVLPAHSQQVFRGGVQVVLVDVSVMKGHTPVTNLTAQQFSVTDNAVSQKIDGVNDAGIALDVSLVVDSGYFTQGLAGAGMGPAGTDELHRNVQQIARLMRPGDRLGVITFASEIEQTRPLSPVDSTSEPISLANPTTNAATDRYPITQAVLTALTAPVATDRRHIIVVFAESEGDPVVPPLEHLLPVAKRADALLYAVLTPPLQEPVTHVPQPLRPSEVMIRDSLTQAAEATGGKAYLTGDIVGAFRQILKEFRSSYVLRYTVQGVPTAGWHDIVVKVPGCPGCTIRARRGYMGR